MDRWVFAVCMSAALIAPRAVAEGHGPVFALATPTLGQGGWNSETALMTVRSDAGRGPLHLGQMIGYGLTEDLQLNLKAPIARSGGQVMPAPFGGMPNHRAGMMGAARDVEASLAWRFHREAPAVGTRRETTLHFGVARATDDLRRGIAVHDAVNAALATGYASRVHYWWVAGGMQYNRGRGGDRLGALYYASAAYGYRPVRFRPDGAPLDLRWFVEAVAEYPRRDRAAGTSIPGTGGRRLLVGPSFLALGGPWGLSGGVLFPLHEDLGHAEVRERYRAKLVVSWWF